MEKTQAGSRRYPRHSGRTNDDRTVKRRAVDGKLLLDLGKKAVYSSYTWSPLYLDVALQGSSWFTNAPLRCSCTGAPGFHNPHVWHVMRAAKDPELRSACKSGFTPNAPAETREWNRTPPVRKGPNRKHRNSRSKRPQGVRTARAARKPNVALSDAYLLQSGKNGSVLRQNAPSSRGFAAAGGRCSRRVSNAAKRGRDGRYPCTRRFACCCCSAGAHPPPRI